jgi:protein-disulfide isomerase
VNRRTVKKILDGAAIAVVATALVVVVSRVLLRRGPVGHQPPGSAVPLERFVELTSTGQWIGPRLAPVVILIYSDYACGFCAELDGNLRDLRVRYPQHVAIVVKHFVQASGSAQYRIPVGAECAAEQGRFAEYHDEAFRHGRLLSYSNGWRMLADSARIPDMDAFVNCVLADRPGARIGQQYDEGRGLGVAVTPTLFVNGERIIGSPPASKLDSLVAERFPDRLVKRNQ